MPPLGGGREIKMIYFRVDANEEIAMGHVMRCLSIADALKKFGEDSTFITADNKSDFLIMNRGYPSICLHSEWNCMDNEIYKLLEVIKAKKIRFLIIDSYYVTRGYMEKLSNNVKIAYIDDMGFDWYICDLLVNYSIYAKDIFYEKIYPQTKLVLGCSYVPLREQFMEVSKKKIKNEIRCILVLTGGADSNNFAYKFISYLNRTKRLTGMNVNIICGNLNKNRKILESLIDDIENIKIFYNVEDIAVHMMQADIVISAGGSTLYELCACGTPAISYSFADNQVNNVRYFDKINLIPCAGDIRNGAEPLMNRIVSLLEGKMSSVHYRREISKRMQLKIDGKGSERLAEVLRDFYKLMY